jgi:hypothetical protein
MPDLIDNELSQQKGMKPMPASKVDRMNVWPFQNVSKSRWNRLSERQKGYVEESFRREIEVIEMSATSSRRHDLRVIQGGKVNETI